MSQLHEATGTLRYRALHNVKTGIMTNTRLAVEVDQELADYYRSLIPKYIEQNRPRWPAHITVVRAEKETPTIMEPWGRYEGQKINFLYSPEIQEGKIYYWLNVFCKRLEEIRIELGLPCTSQYTQPPEGFRKCFHMTIANCKT